MKVQEKLIKPPSLFSISDSSGGVCLFITLKPWQMRASLSKSKLDSGTVFRFRLHFVIGEKDVGLARDSI